MKRSRRHFLWKRRTWLWLLSAVLCLALSVGALWLLRPKSPNLPASGTESTEAETPDTTESSSEESSSEEATTQAHPFSGKAVVTASGYLNIRKDPNTDADVIGRVHRGSVAEILETGKRFTRIQSGKVTGWVSNDYILTGAAGQEFAEENSVWTATVLADRLNVREKADDTSTVLATVEKNQVFIVEEQNGKWIRIFYTSSISGYISAEYAKAEVNPGRAISMQEEKELLELYREKESERQSSIAEEEAKKTTAAKPSTQKTTQAATTQKPTQKPTQATTTTPEPEEETRDELALLAALCQAEAGYNYDNCRAVAIVVMNRVRSKAYPNNVYDVIYQKGQFSPASSGKLDKILLVGANDNAKKAAAEALAGATTVMGQPFDYAFFCSVSIAKYENYSRYIVIGDNCFYWKK